MGSKIENINLRKIKESQVSFPKDNPFENIKYLQALEESNSASTESGWQASHLGKFNNGELLSFLPLYKKFNSYGEFIFDYQWANALAGSGRKYYPKLLTAIPFTPCEGERVFGITREEKIELINSGIEKLKKENIESWHILFPNEDSREILQQEKFIERYNYRFTWNNKGFSDFNDFLSIFTSRQRATIKKERKSIKKNNISFVQRNFDQISLKDWDLFYSFYQQTYHDRGQNPYLTKDFFYKINSANQILKPIIFFAYEDKKPIAASLCFRGNHTLYGRHWGAVKKVKNLHFECCYYQGIEYCIKNKIKYFDPGVQGEHKIRRGFEPKLTSSFHYFLKEDFEKAVRNYCDAEKVQIKNYLEVCKTYTPFNKDYKINS
ncbi:MAG: GNAT family N-acetyltransferase [Pseudomonadota bacterium]|nr:GNAT family N-acetyltransferase [Pseudomonadota bacterium]